MPTAVKRKLSGSTDGKQIKVAATASPGTTVHTSVSGTTDGTYDELWLWAYNSDSTARTLYIQLGGTTSPDDIISVVIPALSGLQLVCPGLILQNGSVVRAYCSVTNVVMVSGFVNRISD